MKTILIAIDFSPVSKTLLRIGAELAETCDARLRLLHVAAPDPSFVGYQAGPQTERNSRAHELRDEHKKIQSMADSLASRGIDAVALLVEGQTVKKVLEKARDWEADMILMGTRSHGLLKKAVLGSVSEGVIHDAHCPVIVVPESVVASN